MLVYARLACGSLAYTSPDSRTYGPRLHEHVVKEAKQNQNDDRGAKNEQHFSSAIE
jgi:hypothetical protein